MKKLYFLIFSACLIVSQTYAGQALHAKILEKTEDNLIKAGAVKTDSSSIAQKKYLFIYFSAHWCPPCRAFTPKLVEFYNQTATNADFDLLFVSSDKDQASMDKYMSETKMPWTALKLKCEKAEALKKQFGVSGIPCLVLLDDQDNVIASSFKGEEYLGPQVAVEKYQALHAKK